MLGAGLSVDSLQRARRAQRGIGGEELVRRGFNSEGGEDAEGERK